MNGTVLAGGGWNIVLWSAQLFLCAMFVIAGILKLSKTPRGLADMGWHWAETVPPGFIQALAVLEIAGAIGIVLPAFLGILPVLVPLSAAGMILVQVCAIVLHAARKETAKTLWLNLILLASAALVVLGRFEAR